VFGRLFGRRPAVAVEDAVWADRAARDAGWLRWPEAPATLPIVHVVRSSVDMDSTLAALAARRPWRVSDGHEAAELRHRLAQPEALAVALDDRLRASAASGLALPAFQARIRGRAIRRADDESLVAALARLGARRIEFHGALDEAPVAEHARRLRPLLERLDIGTDEPVVSEAITRSIERIQR
jgi:hypothetical protein